MLSAISFFTILFAVMSVGHAQVRIPDDPPRPMEPLSKIPVPGPSEEHLAKFIRSKKAVIQLGKALYWDTKVGSDNKIACASCHFHAGADSRSKNQINPGIDNKFQFGKPNHRLFSSDFPIPFKRNKKVDDIVSSQGIFKSIFVSASANNEECSDEDDEIFHGLSSNGSKLNTRRVEPRNTPTTINAVFNFRNFWDGRANNVFNGIDPFGLRNKDAFVWKVEDGKLKKESISLRYSSLASQASGPPLSGLEMSCKQRQFMDIAKKLLNQPILSNQKISPTDSVLGSISSNKPHYARLIKSAFKPEWWNTNMKVKFTTEDAARIGSMDLFDAPIFSKRIVNEEISLMESNFSLFFGLAVQMYVSTLVADDTPLDRYLAGDLKALTKRQIRGKKIFETKGKCINCHSGAELTNASVSNVPSQRLEQMVMGDGFTATYDNGFYNIAVTPTKEDLGVGGKDPFGNPLSETRMVQLGLGHLLGSDFDTTNVPEIRRIAVDGAFKTPGLRNVALTGPYFHNGGKSTLMQVVDFYDRGGDFRNQNHDDMDPDIRRLHLTDDEKEELVDFLLALTDERVRLKRAPFDHPSICITNGHSGTANRVSRNGSSNRAIDTVTCMQAIGKSGVKQKYALRPFLNVDHYRGDEFKETEVATH
jgi:cytochrome c peroxidase